MTRADFGHSFICVTAFSKLEARVQNGDDRELAAVSVARTDAVISISGRAGLRQ